MRVIAGTHRGRRLRGPTGTAVRPTSDRVREAVFSILGTRVAGSRVLDLYAGTGAVGIEALSRGAEHVTAVESSRQALKLLRQNVADCGLSGRFTVHHQDVEDFLTRADHGGPFTIVFADPPYAAAENFATLFHDVTRADLCAPDVRLVIEHGAKVTLPARIASWSCLRRYRYGDTAVSLYAASPATPS